MERTEPVDSLLWSVKWISAYYNKQTSISVLFSGLPRDRVVKPETALRMLEKNGIAAAWVTRKAEDIFSYLFPAVVTRKDGSVCILVSRQVEHKSVRYTLALPEKNGGLVILNTEEFDNIYGGYALLCGLIPQIDHRKDDVFPDVSRKENWLFSTLWRFRHYFLSAAFAAVLANILTLSTVFFTMNVYDRVVPTQAYVTLWSLAVGVTIAITLEFIIRLIRAYLLDTVGKKADLIMGNLLFRQMLGMRMENRPQSSGSFAHQFREFETIRDFVTSATLATISDLPFCLLFLVVIYMIGGALVLVPLTTIPVIILVSLIMQWPLSRATRQNVAEISQRQGLLIESIGGLETLKSVHGEGVMLRRWDNYSALSADSSRKTKFLSSFLSGFMSLVQQATTIMIVVAGVYLIHDGQLTMGAMIGATILAGRAMGPLRQVVGLASRFQHARMAHKSLTAMMERPPERDPEITYLSSPSFQGNLTLRSVDFSYPQTAAVTPPPVLKGINLSVTRGERVAIIGSIGSGKSTLLRVIARLLRPVQGSVLIDNIDATQVDPADWRGAVGFVGSDSRLFYGSLRDNLMIGNPSASTEDLLRVVRMTGVDRIAASNPLGFDMQVGEAGVLLSGGQRQLVSLARTLLLNPEIILMDEPTSAMDSQTERRFIAQLKTSVTDETLILVTHRMSLLELVDRIVVLENGKIITDGPKETVLSALRNQGRKAGDVSEAANA
ncbi:type I secretion system permease/ATPase [Citrobacter sedlakii]|uniref:type I secretion system permease/ATPase n=1 Tax=Citrobacter sedlakii TaxID=67826 RepID=UPI001BA52D86|nr:type I secretion system permease/ATPase [Citrobacter sedlakii]EKJ8220854.1 type I secretion system permease/ATPase [Citrobacter sedlakii]QUC29637.1 type I secretion system permease/ATPase [Citrobacter sedlakii]